MLKDAVIATLIATEHRAGPYKNSARTILAGPEKSHWQMKDHRDVVVRLVNFHQGEKLELHTKWFGWGGRPAEGSVLCASVEFITKNVCVYTRGIYGLFGEGGLQRE